jgi:hypothetical protein
MVYWGADKSRTQSRAKPGGLWARSQAPTRTAAPQSPVQPRAVLPASATTTSRLFWPLAVPLAALLPELRRKESSAKIESESRKDKHGYLFWLPGHRNFYE